MSVFILGAPRSGTSLLRVMLNAHPRLALPHECKVIQEAMRVHPENRPLDKDELPGFCELVCHVPRFAEIFNLNAPALQSLLEEEHDLRPSALIGCLYNFAMGKNGAIWGDKNIGYTWIAPQLAAWIPESRFIHVVRDVRDMAWSASTRLTRVFLFADQPYYMRHPYGGALLWKNELHAARTFAAEVDADRYLEIHYEDIAAEPESTCRTLCAFLELDYDPAMLQYDPAMPADSLQRYHENLRSPPSAEYIGKGIQHLKPAHSEAILRACAEEMVEHGYTNSPPPGVHLPSLVVDCS
jgi:hypothetical protein